MKKFCIEYRHKGRTFDMEFEAENFEDAQARLNSAYFNGEILQRVGGVSIGKA